MKLTPLEIKKQRFKKAMRGYDAVEVETFLEKVAEDYDHLLQENVQLHKQFIGCDSELKHYKDVEKTLKQTLYNIQQSSQLSRETSQKEANLIKKEAELTAAQMVEEARFDVRRMEEEIITLKQQKASFIARLRHLLSSHLELLDVLDMDDVDRAEIKDRTRKGFSAEKKGAALSYDAGNNDRKSETTDLITDEETAEHNSATLPSKKSEASSPKTGKKGQDLLKDIFKDQLDVDEFLT